LLASNKADLLKILERIK